MSSKSRRKPGIDPLAANPRGRKRGDPYLPLINVAYLLLTFFLIVCALQIGEAAHVVPNKDGAQTPPQASALMLDVAADGGLRFQGRTMPVAEAVIAIRAAMPRAALAVRADRKMPASAILPLLWKLREGGIASIRVVPVGPS